MFSEGGKVICPSHTSSVSCSVEILDLNNPQVLANGQYGKFIVAKASKIFQDTLEKHAVEFYYKSPFSESLFLKAYEELGSEMTVNYKVIVPFIISNLASLYIGIAEKYNVGKTKIVPGSAAYKKRADMVKIVIVFVQESTANGGKFTDEQALTILEFMYRFFGTESGGDRYGLSLQSLYAPLAFEKFPLFYGMLVQYFDPNFLALPVFYLTITEDSMMYLKHAFTDFIENIFNKLMVLDQVSDKEAFNRHACMLISSMISCNFYEEFNDMVFKLIQLVDMAQLSSSPRFAKSIIAIFKINREDDLLLLDFLVSQIIEDSVILSLMPYSYIDLGSIIYQIFHDHLAIYDKYVLRLSKEASERLNLIEETFWDYNQVISELSLFDSLEILFPSMNVSHLTNVFDKINAIIPVFPDYFLHNSQDSGLMLMKIVRMVPKLVRIALNNSDPELDAKRFVLLVKMIELTISGDFLIQAIMESFSNVLLLYNLQTYKILSNPELDEAHESITAILKILIDGNNFFKTIQQRAILHNYHGNLVLEEADEMTNLVLIYNLEMSSNKSFVFAENIETVNKLKIEANTQMVNYVLTEINEFLASFTISNSLDKFKEGKVLLMARMLLKNKMVSKTEELFLRAILALFSSEVIPI